MGRNIFRIAAHSTAVLCCVLPMATGAQSGESAPSVRVAPVEWPEGPTSASSGADLPVFASSASTLLPVLVPAQFFSFRSLSFVGEPASYAASVRAIGATLSVTGTRIAFDETGSTPAAPSQQPTEIVSELGERSASAGYVRFGAAYRIDIECERAADERCRSDTYARRLVAALQVVGGSEGTPPVPVVREEEQSGPTSALALPDGWAKPAGTLVRGSGRGVVTQTVYSPRMRFPVESAPAYLNSQVWGIGGMNGPPGGWSDRRNYAYPWYDNFCETRSRSTPNCPGGRGHQGQDIRPAGPERAKYWAVAAEDGRISRLGSYSVILVGASGTEYRYLHLAMDRLAVRAGDRVTRGQRLGLISNYFGGTPTTVHLHFEMLQNVNGAGLRHVPPYTSLTQAYQQL